MERKRETAGMQYWSWSSGPQHKTTVRQTEVGHSQVQVIFVVPIIKKAKQTKKQTEYLCSSHTEQLSTWMSTLSGAIHSNPPLPALKQWLQSRSLAAQETGLKNLLSNETLLLWLNKEKSQKKAQIPYPISERQDLCFIMADTPHTQHIPEIVGKSPVKA